MVTDETSPQARPQPVKLSCGCIRYFRCKPYVGDELICTFHDSHVRVIRSDVNESIQVA